MIIFGFMIKMNVYKKRQSFKIKSDQKIKTEKREKDIVVEMY